MFKKSFPDKSAFIATSFSVKTQEEIVFSSWGSITETRILEKLIKDFEKENPYIKIKFMLFNLINECR